MKQRVVVLLCVCLLSSFCITFGRTASQEGADESGAAAAGGGEDTLEQEDESAGKVEAEGDDQPQSQPQQGVASDTQEDDSGTQQQQQGQGQTGTSGPEVIKASPNADATMLFFNPPVPRQRGVELPAGKLVKILVGFSNKHEREGKSFTLDSLEASFRYPQDYNFYLQNFTVARFNQEVEATHEATIEYSFTPALQLAGRPFGLHVGLRYHDSDAKLFFNAVFNETVQVVEIDEGFDGETFFMYVFVLAVILLLAFGIYHFFAVYGVKKLNLKQLKKSSGFGVSSSRKAGGSGVEMGTAASGDVDFEWLPKHTLDQMKANRSPKQSPRQRKVRRDAAESQQD